MPDPLSPEHAALLQERDLTRAVADQASRRLQDWERLNLAQPCQSRGCGALADPGQHYCPDCLTELRHGWNSAQQDRDFAERRG